MLRPRPFPMQKHLARYKKLRSNKLARLLMDGIFVLLVLALVRSWTLRDMVDGEVPALQAVQLDGRVFDLRQAPRPILIHFWATWCSICRLEQDAVQALSEDYPVITIAMQSGDVAEIQRFMQQNGLDFPVINDPDGSIARRFGVRAVPASFFVDAGDSIVFRESGYTTGWGLRLRGWWAGL